MALTAPGAVQRLVQGPPPAGPNPHGTATFPPPGETDIGARVTLVCTFFSVGLGVALLELGGTLVSAGFSVRGLHATVTEPTAITATPLKHRVRERILACMVAPLHCVDAGGMVSRSARVSTRFRPATRRNVIWLPSNVFDPTMMSRAGPEGVIAPGVKLT
ncbi:MAG: hypothetical protein U0R66_17000 [Mycobacterium sp.]